MKTLTVQELEGFMIFSDLSDMIGKKYTVIKETEGEYKIRRGHFGLSSFTKEIFEIVGQKKSNSSVHNIGKERVIYDAELRRKKR